MITVHFYVTSQLSAFMCTMEEECINKLAVSKVYGKTVDGRCATFDCLTLCFKMDQVKMTRSNKLCSHFEYTSPILWNFFKKVYAIRDKDTARNSRNYVSVWYVLMTTKPTKFVPVVPTQMSLTKKGDFSFFCTTTRSGCLKKIVTKQNLLFTVLIGFMNANKYFTCFNEGQW
jgi:hypothetical protein